MRGRQVFFETLLAHGVDRIFGNPGTTESPLLDRCSTTRNSSTSCTCMRVWPSAPPTSTPRQAARPPS